MTITRLKSRHSSEADSPAWLTVDTGHSSEWLIDMADVPHPLPVGCERRWRAFVIVNEYHEEWWVLQAKRRLT